ncbi:hypothetical protein RN001_006154 [Aquatica leii]|uniref:Chaoptin n=1 Tax=Aquatica leii TaxID=1421715 RepID=A0AAN7P7H6_9COLE|nr:hypothetical protein RN001_006154 [Aquatica leii]
MKSSTSLWFYLPLLIVSILCLTSRAKEIDSMRDPPCYFNPLCSCSKAIPDLGIVRCQDTLLSMVPQAINNSKAFMLQLDNVGLRRVEPYFLQSTGLYKLSITRNPLAIIPDDAFVGLERTLWKLDLSNNDLLNVPSKAIRYLHKLKVLDLTGNDITQIFPDSWRGLEHSLETLILAENSIAYLAPDTFTGLPHLDTINLKGNNLRDIDPSVFREGMDKLAHIILADNQLSSIPYLALSPLKVLRTLDLSYNRINRMFPTMESGAINIQIDVRMSLDFFDLSFNQLEVLESSSFQYFNTINKTHIDGNPLFLIEDNAFRQAKIKELYIRSCRLTVVTPTAFDGLENSLQILDLSGNNLTSVQDEILDDFSVLQSLSLGDNLIRNFAIPESAKGLHQSLLTLDFSGSGNNPISTDQLQQLKGLRKVYLSKLKQQSITRDTFSEFGAGLEELRINFGEIKSIKNHAFTNVHSLKVLDLSENRIDQIENEAFVNLGHSLKTLQLAHAFSSSMGTLPTEPLKLLWNLRHLDISNNKIRNLPHTSFHFMKKLRSVEIQDNEIENIQPGTFQGNIHSKLEVIYLSYNKIKTIQENTFSDLEMLEQLYLDDNKITSLDKRSFMDLENLKRLNLKGNKLSQLAYETFQNLPELEDLDMSYNELTDFQFSVLDQVGTLATFSVNVSHNRLTDLAPAVNFDLEPEGGIEPFHSNIKILDLSYNNISQISKHYFNPVEISLTHLYFSHNLILNISREIFGNMPHLQWIDLSFNRLLEFEYNTFKNTRHLQVINLSHNYIAEVPKDLFRSLYNLRVVDMSHNRLKFVPDNLFKEEGLERLDLSNNQLSRLPLTSLSTAAASTLCEFDLSFNGISSLTHGEMLSKFERLAFLDLSYNRLVQVDPGVFGILHKISYLDLSHNSQLSIEKNGKNFQGIEDSLLYLKLDNLSLITVPELPLPNLVYLSLAENALSSIPPEMAGNLTSLRELNLAKNNLTVVPVVTHSLTDLKRLSLSGNPISTLSNTSLLGVANHLEELDITDLPLHTFEAGALTKINYLRTLKIGAYNVKHFSIPKITESNFGLRNIEIDIKRETSLISEMNGNLPLKLRTITIKGKALKNLNGDVLDGVRYPHLRLAVYNTSLINVPKDLFDNLDWVKNLSLDIQDNPNLQYFGNPLTAAKPGLRRKTFIIDVTMNRNKWNCDCSLSWIEIWQRKRRQYLCDSEFNEYPNTKSFNYYCRHVEDDIRNSKCANKANKSVVEVLKTDIECDWSSARSNGSFAFIYILMIIGLLRVL